MSREHREGGFSTDIAEAWWTLSEIPRRQLGLIAAPSVCVLILHFYPNYIIFFIDRFESFFAGSRWAGDDPP